MTKSKINLKSKLESIKDYWSPKVIAELNNYQFKLAKIKDEFIWHEHNGKNRYNVIRNDNFLYICTCAIPAFQDRGTHPTTNLCNGHVPNFHLRYNRCGCFSDSMDYERLQSWNWDSLFSFKRSTILRNDCTILFGRAMELATNVWGIISNSGCDYFSKEA